MAVAAPRRLDLVAGTRRAEPREFAWLLTLHDAASGRAYAAYGGIYVTASLLWLWLVEQTRPDRWDLLGGAVCLAGATVILLGPRTPA